MNDLLELLGQLIDIYAFSALWFALGFVSFWLIMYLRYRGPRWLANILAIPFFLIWEPIMQVLLTLWLLDPPREWTVTARMDRYLKIIDEATDAESFDLLTAGDWRRFDFAVWLCRKLNRIDHQHCKRL